MKSKMKNKPRYCSASEAIEFYSVLDSSGCRIWTASTQGGYGQIYFRGRIRRAHRLAYEVVHGPIPAGMVVCHRCDTPACVNADHLFLGTHADNVADKIAKRRGVCGERQGQAKLTEKQALLVVSDSRPQKRIASDYGISQSAVSLLKAGKTWAHIRQTEHV